MTSPRRMLILGLPALALAAVPATAATPESGTVSLQSPTVKWEGTATGYGIVPINLLLNAAGEGPVPCEQPFCDTFALTVADKADLLVTAAQRAADNFTELHVAAPDGTMQFAQSEDSQPISIKIKNASPGDYTVEVLTNETIEQSGEYDADARLGGAVAPPPTGGGGGDTKPGDPQVNPPQEPQGDARPVATLSVKTSSASLRRSRKGLRLSVTTSSPVTDVRASLKKGKKVVGKGSLKQLSKRGTIKLKLAKRLKPGRYVIAVTAKDGERAVGVQANLRLKR